VVGNQSDEHNMRRQFVNNAISSAPDIRINTKSSRQYTVENIGRNHDSQKRNAEQT